MPQPPQRVRIEELDVRAVFPFVRLFDAFAMAIFPPNKLAVALLMVVLFYVGGKCFSFAAGKQVAPDEITVYAQSNNEQFHHYLDTVSHSEAMRAGREGVFEASLAFKINAFERMVRAAVRGDFGFDGLLAGNSIPRDTVFGALHDAAVSLPSWAFDRHPVFFAFWCIFGLLIWSWLGGTLSRLSALHAARGDPGTIEDALRFVAQRWRSFFAAPLIPFVLTLTLGLLIALIGLLFNVAFLNIVGGLLFGLLIFLGFLAAMLLLLLAGGGGLIYPAIAVEGVDAFQAISHACSYVLQRIWRWLFYTLISLVYGALVYLLVGMIIFLSLKVTRYFAGSLVFAQTDGGANVFDVMMPDPQLGVLSTAVDRDQLGASQDATALLIHLWVKICLGLLAAFALSFYACAQTWIYLLLRQSVDGAGFDEIDEDSPTDPRPANPARAPDKIEPATGVGQDDQGDTDATET